MLTVGCPNGMVPTMTTAVKPSSRLVSGLPSAGAGWRLMLAAVLSTLIAATAAFALAAALLPLDITIVAEVISGMDFVASALGALGPPIIGVWMLYAYGRLVVRALIAAPGGRPHVPATIWTQAARIMLSVLTRLALSWHSRLAAAWRIYFPVVWQVSLARDRTPVHLAHGWRPGLDPALA